MRRSVHIAVVSGMTLITACTEVHQEAPALSEDAATKLVNLCLDQTGAPGLYDWRKDGSVPNLRPISKLGGTDEGASMLNACVRQNVVMFEAPAETPASGPADPVVIAPNEPPTPAAPAVLEQPAARPGCPAGVTGLYRGNILC